MEAPLTQSGTDIIFFLPAKIYLPMWWVAPKICAANLPHFHVVSVIFRTCWRDFTRSFEQWNLNMPDLTDISCQRPIITRQLRILQIPWLSTLISFVLAKHQNSVQVDKNWEASQYKIIKVLNFSDQMWGGSGHQERDRQQWVEKLVWASNNDTDAFRLEFSRSPMLLTHMLKGTLCICMRGLRGVTLCVSVFVGWGWDRSPGWSNTFDPQLVLTFTQPYIYKLHIMQI